MDIIYIFQTSANCPKSTKANRGQFGQNCNYICRCKNRNEQCDQITGECPSQNCQDNWIGPACQYFRIGKSGTDQTLDYNDGSCVSVSSPKDINLGTVYPFNSVTVVFGGSGTRINICVRRQSSDEWSSCVNTTKLTTNTIHAVFRNFVQAQYVRLKFDGSSQNICEIKIITGRNLAYGQAASQSSNRSEGYGTAMNAVDSLGGGTTGGSDTNCIHTKAEVNPWWKVDLGSLYNILWFRVFNWYDSCCDENLVNFTLSLSNSSGGNDLMELYRDNRTSLAKATTENPIVVSNIKILQGRYVYVTRPGTLNAALMLCEIHIFGECPDNACGFTCNESCYCKVASYVDKLKGLCFEGCQPGWTGDGYRCDKICAAGKFGDNCTQECGNCSISPCNHVDGKCTEDKCKAGYTGPYCMQPCDAGKYGDDCKQECGNCSTSPCNHVNGKCIADKCKAGYRGSYCKQPCAAGKYGADCLQECGNCSTSPCNHVDGSCTDNKCKAGYRGLYCKQPCAEGTYGDKCLLNCGNCSIPPCNHMDGRCTYGTCEAGYRGDYCNQTCVSGKYGGNCSFECGNCNTPPCNHVDGKCTKDKCAAGYIGPYCKQPCVPGKYGDNCSQACGNCSSPPCNHVDGKCFDDNCEAGYRGDYCKQPCTFGTYGINCGDTCGQCKDNVTCDPRTGECIHGCKSGWEETDKCNVKSAAQPGPKETTGSAAGIAGGISAAVVVIVIVVVVLFIFLKRRARHQEDKERTSSQRSFNNLEGLTYENAGAFIGDVKPISPKPKTNKEEDETYYNVPSGDDKLHKGTVLLKDLWDYVQTKISSLSGIEDEFKTLPSGLKHPTTDAKKPQNIQLNRYRNLYAYDHSRVHLIPDTEDDGDYVNACFVDGFNKPKAFIASQGATLKNMNDIWRMIWQQNCGKVVMLTNRVEHGVTKCEQYWPDEGETQYGSVSVIIQECDKLADCTVRIFRISHKTEGRSKIVKHLHYTAWPDKDVPGVASSLVQFWNKVKQTTCPMNGPVLVHCSAGIGRTGTFIALDYLVEQGRMDGCVNFAECVRKIREQRVNLVQTKEQYLFLHEAVVEALMLSGTGIASDQFHRTYIELQQIDIDKKQTKLFLEYEKLQQGNPFDRERVNLADDDESDNAKDEFVTAKLPENLPKNRYSNILAADKYRPHLTSPPKGCSNYINAVYMPSHRDRSAFILTQMPLPSTVEEFWTLIQEEEIHTVVMMNIHNPRTAQLEAAAYWPEQNDVTFGDFKVESIDSKRESGFKTRDIRWTRNSTGDTSALRQFQFCDWPDKSKIPTDHHFILHLFEGILQWQRQSQSSPILVHCMDGAERSGLFCVLSTIIERLNIERDVAVAQTIKKMRIIRQQIIPNYEQFQFCHDVVLEYLKTFDTYSNFA